MSEQLGSVDVDGGLDLMADLRPNARTSGHVLIVNL